MTHMADAPSDTRSFEGMPWHEAIDQFGDSGDDFEAAPPVMTRLRESTRDLHDALEALPFNQRLMEGELSSPEYGAWLRALLVIHDPLETELRRRSDDRLASIWDERRARSQYLVEDLEQLELPVGDPDSDVGRHALASARQIVDDWSQLGDLDLLGVLYVTEGSTLGGMYIAKQLRETSEVLGNATSFYTAHGQETRPLWDAFGETMNEALRDPGEIRRCVSAARVLFAGFGDILQSLS